MKVAHTPPAARRAVALRLALGCLLALCACLRPAVAAADTAPAPAWSFAVSSHPTNFVPGTTGTQGSPPGYLVVATNIGGAATSGSFTIADTLPAGLGFSTPEGAVGIYGAMNEELTCVRAGQTVTCSGGAPSLKPGETAQLWIPVKVASNAPSSVVNMATLSGGGAFPVAAETETAVGSQLPSFGFVGGAAGLRGVVANADGSPATLAGSHPYQFSAGMSFPASASSGGELLAAGGGVRDLAVDLPRGMVVDAGAVAERCTEAQLEGSGCPDQAQVGTVALALALGPVPKVASVALYAMVPPPGTAVDLGLELSEGVYAHLQGGVRSDGDYGLSADIRDISAKVPVLGAGVTLWGDPSDASHDFARGHCLGTGGACPVPRTATAFLTLPGSCAGPLATGARADSWTEPGAFARAGFESPAIDGCNSLEFGPTISVRPSTNLADSPTGLSVDLHVPQRNDYEGLATANLRDAEVTLPEGVAVNPSGADGLGACTAAQVGLLTAPGQTPIRFASVPSSCPDSAKVGTAEIDTPILDHPLRGSVYLAQPDRNPFGSLLAIYLVIEDQPSGTVVKLAGRIEADPGSGQLTLGFEEAPQLPLEDIELDLFGGPRALLKTPIGCGAYVTGSDLTPWSSPEGANATPTDGFGIDVAPGGTAPCPGSEATAPNRPGFDAGAVAPRAGAHSPFVLRLGREDGSQRLASLQLTAPPGLAGTLAGIPYCPEAQLGSCPDAAEVGTVAIGAGAGIAPLALSGHAYLAGPYRGAPLSLAIAVPALAGPFDLGDVVVRTALHVDPQTAQIHAVSDPLPAILRGIPLDVRSIELRLDRPGFTLNPTSCDPMSVAAAASSVPRQSASLSSPFQVGGCRRLGFEPRLAVRFTGPTRRGAHPGFRTVFRARRGDANVGRVAVTLPGTELLDNRHIATVCARAQFAAGQCPPGSIYGRAQAWSPLLARPLEGPVYLRASRHRLPDLVASLDGQVHLDLVGRVDSVRGRLRNTFAALPDVPLDKLVLTMRGGRKGLLVNTTELCGATRRAGAALDAQNGKFLDTAPVVKMDCG